VKPGGTDSSLRTKPQQLINGDGYPQFVLRLGFASEPLPTSPRRNVLEVFDEVKLTVVGRTVQVGSADAKDLVEFLSDKVV
jgi:hypothetical protein